MVQMLMLSIFRQLDPSESPIRLAESLHLDNFSFWQRGTIKEHIHFGSRTVVQRTSKGQRQSVALKEAPFIIHCYVRFDGLACICITDVEYPPRVAFGLLSKTLETFEEKVKDKWTKVIADQDVEPPFMKEDLIKFQDPSSDKINKIQKDLDEIKEVMHANIDELLKRGETLDSLMNKSSDLSESSKMFYKKSKDANSCCRSW